LFSGNPVDVAAVAWTPDGRDLVLSGTTGGSDWSLWRVPADGSVAPQRLSAGGTAGKSFAISRPAASGAARLAYTREIFDSNVWRARLDTSGKAGTPERLIASTRNDTTPQYSPDGNKIAFASTRSGAFEIWVANADGTSPVQLTSFAKYSATPRWSPDGAWIAFDSNAEGQWDVYVVAAAGGRPRRLTDNPARDAVPSWSRDGKWIYFSSDRTGENQIWKVPPAGGQQVQVTSAGGHVPFESVDGKTLYYTKEYDLHPSLWSVPVEGGQETRVLESVSWRGFAPRKDGIWFLRWYGAERVTRIHFYSFAGGPLKTAAEIDSWAGNGLSVSPDGRTLLFTCRETAGADLMLIDPFR
jgi:Tol biopolymer transport system component